MPGLPQPVKCPTTGIGLQLVGLNVKPGRLTLMLIWWICDGKPLTNFGAGSLVTVAWAVFSSTVIFDITGMWPRLNSPTCVASVTSSRPNGAPWNGPVRQAVPPSTTCEVPRPATAVDSPIALLAGQFGSAFSASAVGHGVTDESIAAAPGGSVTEIVLSAWSPSARPIVTVNGANAPPWVVPPLPATKPGLKGWVPGGEHGAPLAPWPIASEPCPAPGGT